jgi:ubiquitin-protein ligase
MAKMTSQLKAAIKRVNTTGDTKPETSTINTTDDIEVKCIKESARIRGFILDSIKSTTSVPDIQNGSIIGSGDTNRIAFFNRKQTADVILTDYMKLFKGFLLKRITPGRLDLVDGSIYHWKIILDHSSKNKTWHDVVISIKLHPQLHPNYPPHITIEEPKFKHNLNTRIARSKFTALEYWSCDRTVFDIINRVDRIVERYGETDNIKTKHSNVPSIAIDIMKAIETQIEALPIPFVDDKGDEIDKDQKFVRVSDIIASNNNKKSKKYVDNGTGYGHSKSSVWDPAEYLKMIKERHNKFITIMRAIIQNVNKLLDMRIDISCTIETVKSSQLYLYMIKEFNNISVLEINNNASYYGSIFDFIHLYCLENTVSLFYEENEDQSLYKALHNLRERAESCLEFDKTNENANMIDVICSMIEYPYKIYSTTVKTKCEDSPKNNTKIPTAIVSSQKKVQSDVYINAMIKYKKTVAPGLSTDPSYYYNRSVNESESSDNMKSCYKRLSNEIPALIEGLPVHEDAIVLINIDKTKPNCIRYLLNGPPDTPYARGLFVFDSYCGSRYPETAPEFHFVNTGNFRFNPNFYAEGKVCLSILGTYSGPTPHLSEKWNPGLSTLSQVIISIHSQIFTSDPYFNEPGNERERSTIDGIKSSKIYNVGVRYATMRAGMLDLIKSADKYPQFKKAILTHFYLQKDKIIDQCKKWVDEYEKGNDNNATHEDMLSTYQALKHELNAIEIDI